MNPCSRALKIAFVVASLGVVPFLISVFWAIVELGDPPYSQNDLTQRICLWIWLPMFLLAILIGLSSRDESMARLFIAAVSVSVILGLFFVL